MLSCWEAERFITNHTAYSYTSTNTTKIVWINTPQVYVHASMLCCFQVLWNLSAGVDSMVDRCTHIKGFLQWCNQFWPSLKEGAGKQGLECGKIVTTAYHRWSQYMPPCKSRRCSRRWSFTAAWLESNNNSMNKDNNMLTFNADDGFHQRAQQTKTNKQTKSNETCFKSNLVWSAFVVLSSKRTIIPFSVTSGDNYGTVWNNHWNFGLSFFLFFVRHHHHRMVKLTVV